MIVLHVTIQVKPEHAAEFLEVVRHDAEHSENDEPGCLRLHRNFEMRIRFALARQKFQKVPLRHHRDVRRLDRQMRKIGYPERSLSEPCDEVWHFLMWQGEKLIEPAKLVHDAERRGMNGVATKIAQEIAVLFKHDNINSGTRQENAEHHACWSPARYAARHVAFHDHLERA